MSYQYQVLEFFKWGLISSSETTRAGWVPGTECLVGESIPALFQASLQTQTMPGHAKVYSVFRSRMQDNSIPFSRGVALKVGL